VAENPHYKELLRLLNEFEVEYLIVGGFALLSSKPTTRQRITTVPFTDGYVSKERRSQRMICGLQVSSLNIRLPCLRVTHTLTSFLSSPASSHGRGVPFKSSNAINSFSPGTRAGDPAETLHR